MASGRLKPGDRLPAERDLSAKFKVSRNTLREALRALELSGMIELRKGAAGGAFVLPGSSGVVVNGLRDLYHLGAIKPEDLTEARVWLSQIVVRVACERLTEEDLAALERNVELAAQATKAGNFALRAELHQQFHNLLAAATRNPIITITMEDVLEVMREFIKIIGPSDNAYTLPSRRRLLKHLRARRRRGGRRDDQVPRPAAGELAWTFGTPAGRGPRLTHHRKPADSASNLFESLILKSSLGRDVEVTPRRGLRSPISTYPQSAHPIPL